MTVVIAKPSITFEKRGPHFCVVIIKVDRDRDRDGDMKKWHECRPGKNKIRLAGSNFVAAHADWDLSG